MGARKDAAAQAKRRHPDVDAFLARQPLPARMLAAELRALVKRRVDDAREGISYGVPFFFLDGVAFCYVSPAKERVTLGFTMGASIHDASGRLVGTGRSPIRKVALALDEGVPPHAAGWIDEAARLARATPPGRPPRGAGSSSRTGPRRAARSTRRP